MLCGELSHRRVSAQSEGTQCSFCEDGLKKGNTEQRGYSESQDAQQGHQGKQEAEIKKKKWERRTEEFPYLLHSNIDQTIRNVSVLAICLSLVSEIFFSLSNIRSVKTMF